MSFRFLSDEWFAAVAKLKSEMGDLEAPASLQDLAVNIVISNTEWGDRNLALVKGNLEVVKVENAPTTMHMPADLAKRMIIENDQSAGMEGFMSGKIRVEGDMSKLMLMQSSRPSAKQKEFQKKILAVTTV